MTREKLTAIINALIKMRDAATDETALETVDLYPAWKPDTHYEVDGKRYLYDGHLYTVRQEHTSQATWTPDITPALYEMVTVGHSGTADDPIPYEIGMAIKKGLYYTENGIRYRCTRDSGNPLYNALADLVDIYVVVE